MDEKDWQLLQVLYACKNITKAAEKLYISQPALTYRLRQIEEEFGVKIVNRSKKGVHFTEEGEYLVQYVKKMSYELRSLKDRILNISDKVQGILRLGVSSNFAHYRLPLLLKEYLDQYPNVQVNLMTGWSSEIMHKLQNDEVQIGIVRGDYLWEEEKHLIEKENICIISNQDIKIEDLPNMMMINYVTDPLLQNEIDRWWKNNFAKPPLIGMEVDRVQTCTEMVKNGLGCAIIPKICLRSTDNFFTIDLTDEFGEKIIRETWMFYSYNALELSTVRTFVNFIIDKIQ